MCFALILRSHSLRVNGTRVHALLTEVRLQPVLEYFSVGD